MRIPTKLKVLIKKGAHTLKIPLPTQSPHQPFLFKISENERIVEYAWVLMNMIPYQKGIKILDIGCHGTLFPILLASQGFEVTGMDLKDYEYTHPNFRFVKGDILNPPESILNQKFNVITAVSSIEHVGLTENVRDHDGDLKAVGIAKSLLVDNGILFFSAGFGGRFQFHHHPSDPEKRFGRLYDNETIEKLFLDFKEVKKQSFIESNGKWEPCGLERASEIIYPKVWLHTKSIICVLAKK